MKRLHNLLIVSLLYVALLIGCSSQTKSTPTIQDEDTPISSVQEIPVPKSFTRLVTSENSIGKYLRNLSFKEDNTVYLYNGQTKYNQSAQYAVLDIDVGTRDLQQCADATMRLRAEHLYQTKQFDKIQFHFTSGHLASWNKYAEGYRPKISGSSVQWVKSKSHDTTYSNFRRYMNLVFSYCGTASMNKEVTPILVANIQPGDVFHQTGNPYGHAVTVMDVAEDSTGKRIFLLSQSYMPAQSIHILKNPSDDELSPWFSVSDSEALETPEWNFPAGSLKRWKN